jgi:twitching motility protein PilT
MHKSQLDRLLTHILNSHDGIADLFFIVGRAFQVEVHGTIKPVAVEPAIETLTPFHTERIVNCLIGQQPRLIRDWVTTGSCDTSYAVGNRCRLRVNIFRQRGNYGVVMRILANKIPTVEALGLPSLAFGQMAKELVGLILITGATGSGKTTTLAALLNAFNEGRANHIVTLEDPIEFVHPHKRATFSQRELGNDFNTFANGLRAALREAPKVIFVGELRDRETTEIAITAAETGHLVVSTLHTIDAGQSINRILGQFEQAEQAQMRQRLAETLRWVVSQRLAPKVGGGRQLLMEIMGSSMRTREAILLGESEERTFYDIISAGTNSGWQTFDQAIVAAFAAGAIDEETAMAYGTRRGTLGRALDQHKHALAAASGHAPGENSSGMRLAVKPTPPPAPAPIPKPSLQPQLASAK